MNHEELRDHIDKRTDEIRTELLRIDGKMDAFTNQCTQNTTDIRWLKAGGATVVTILIALAGIAATVLTS